MTAICPPLVPRGLNQSPNNMVLAINGVTSGIRKGVKVISMDTKHDRVTGGHMTGGRVVRIRPSVIGAEDNHKGHSEIVTNHTAIQGHGNQHRSKLHRSDTVRANLGSIWPVLTLNESAMVSPDNARQSVLLCATQDGPRLIWAQVPLAQMVPQTQLTQDKCSCLTVKRHSSSSSDEVSEPSRSPRSSLHQLPETPCRVEGPSPTPPPTIASAEVQKYENIPVPGIIPKSRATSSPTPPIRKEMISVYSRLLSLNASSDRHIIMLAEERLKSSGFYFDSISAPEAKKILHPTEVGTFLVRISSQSSHFFALSVKTNRGTTSIRISFDQGSFRLDADPESIAKMPAFDCVVGLIEHYVVQSASDARNKCVFLESSGRRDTPVILTRPYRKQPQSLKHMCRRKLHYHLSETELEQYLHSNSASVQLRQYIQSYPYAL